MMLAKSLLAMQLAAVSPPALGREQPSAPPVAVAPAQPPSAPRWSRGAPIKLMVLTEVNSRSAHPGDRFKLRVQEPLLVDGAVAIPVGATAWAEVVSAGDTEAAGGRGHLGMRLLFVDTTWGRVPLTGTQGSQGKSQTAGVVLSVMAWGPLGLLMKGNNATFKAGDIIDGAIDAGENPQAKPMTVGG